MIQLVNGYEMITSEDGYTLWTSLHQLLGIADGMDPYKVFGEQGYVIHHKNGISWDNRVENIELMTNSEHASLHADERAAARYDNSDKPWWDEELMSELYHDKGMTLAEIGEKFDVRACTIRQAFDKLGIERRSRGTRKIEIPRERIAEYLTSDMTQKDLADEFDCSVPTVRKRLRELDSQP